MDMFIENLKKWVVLDKQLKFVNEKTRQIRETKTALTKELCDYVHDRKINNKVIDITNGELRFVEKRDYSPLTFSYIKECLDEIISDKTQVDMIIRYLKDNREIRTSYEIRRIEYDNDDIVIAASKY